MGEQRKMQTKAKNGMPHFCQMASNVTRNTVNNKHVPTMHDPKTATKLAKTEDAGGYLTSFFDFGGVFFNHSLFCSFDVGMEFLFDKTHTFTAITPPCLPLGGGVSSDFLSRFELWLVIHTEAFRPPPKTRRK